MNTRQLWKVKTMASTSGVWAKKTRWIVVADFAELQSALVEDDVISAKFVEDVEVVEDEVTREDKEAALAGLQRMLVEDIARFLETPLNYSGAATAIRRKFGPPVEDEEASKT